MNISELKHPEIVTIPLEDLNLMVEGRLMLELDLLSAVERADLLVDVYGNIVHLCKTVLGIVDGAEGRMNPHCRRTAKGMRRKLDSLMEQITDLCGETDEKLEEMSQRWEFLNVGELTEDDV